MNTKTIHLSDYKPIAYHIQNVDLTFLLNESKTEVQSVMKIEKQTEENLPLILNGEYLELLEVILDNQILHTTQYELIEGQLILHNLPDSFTLKIINYINPSTNTALEGLYKAGDILCTQNEPEGFRRITYFIDRPDNMSIYTTTIIGDKNIYPIMLSNGNLVEEKDLDNNKHLTKWHDPYPKPSYLFALVAGKLGIVQDKFITKSQKNVDLFIYCDIGDEDRCDFAMQSLKNAMRWDEERFNLEYDLSRYMIVATNSFNMGAMENKGLNIFNSHYILANQKTATDNNFMAIESVIGHEYFHNYTGNRITCRDWFELTLKEGLTVFRDQEFSSDMHSRVLQRIDDVEALRARQFVEDASSISHPIKPKSYKEINNFYTYTVYEKGSEVIRMLHTILNEDGFMKGMEYYFKHFDSQAVRTDQFIESMENANNIDLTHFKNWYDNVGTPIVKVQTSYSLKNKTYTMKFKINQDLIVPLKVGLLLDNKKEIYSQLIILENQDTTITLKDIPSKPIISLNRDFSAPVIIEYDYTNDEMLFLLQHDTNSFNRYEMMQQLSIAYILRYYNDDKYIIDKTFLSALKSILEDDKLDLSFKAKLLDIPSLALVKQHLKIIDFTKLTQSRERFIKDIALFLNKEIEYNYKNLCKTMEFSLDPKSIAQRELKNLLLKFMMYLNEEHYFELAFRQFQHANNMTDELGALYALSLMNNASFYTALEIFYQKYQTDEIVMNKYMSIVAGASFEDRCISVTELTNLAEYDIKVPNDVRSVWGSFGLNYQYFHTQKAYKMMVDTILVLDEINPQSAASLTRLFQDYPKLEDNQKEIMKRELKRITSHAYLSKNVSEIIEKILL